MLRAIFAFLALFCAVNGAYAGGLDGQLEKISSQFAKDAAARLPELDPATVAVFPFQAEEALAKKKVDVAVSEMLTQKLLREKRFRLVERSGLDAVLREQKLGLSGAIESDTAARVGRLAGARLAALGSVSRMGKNYQISAKLVDTETADIVSVSIVEVKSNVFEEEAARYLVLVPEVQTLSLYFGMGAIPMDVKSLPATTAGIRTVVPSNAKTGMDMDSGLMPGVGLKYFPFRNWSADLFIAPFFKIGDTKKSVVSNVQANGGVPLVSKAEGKMFRLLVHRQFRPAPKVNLYAGAGLMRLELDPPEDEQDYTTDQSLVGGGTIHMADGFGEGRLASPLLSLGAEWKPQPRFGMSLSVIVPLTGDKYKWDAVVDGTTKVTVWEMSYPKVMPELNLSWYF